MVGGTPAERGARPTPPPTCPVSSRECVRDKDQTPALVPGTLERMFARAASKEHARFSPRVLSRQPWVVAFDSFLSEEQAEC